MIGRGRRRASADRRPSGRHPFDDWDPYADDWTPPPPRRPRSAEAASAVAGSTRTQPTGGVRPPRRVAPPPPPASSRRRADGDPATRGRRMGSSRTPVTPRPAYPPASVWKSGSPRRRLVVLATVTLVLFGAAVGRVGALQTVGGRGYVEKGLSQRLNVTTLPADRGAIFDRNGRALAISVPSSTVYANPRLLAERGQLEAAVTMLQGALALTPEATERLRARLGATDKSFVYVQRLVDDAMAERVSAAADDAGIEGVGVVSDTKRVYPAGDVARGVIGETDSFANAIENVGLEWQYRELLQGTPGQLIQERDVNKGRSIPGGVDREVPAVAGNDLVLTLDATLQYMAEQQLVAWVEEMGAQGGNVVMLDPASGDVLVMASVRRDAKTGRAEVSSANQAVSHPYEPGSVVKIVPAAAALDAGVIRPGQVINVPQVKKFYDGFVRDTHIHYDGDAFDIEDIIAWSSNVGTAIFAQQLGPARLEEYLRAFGFGEPAGIGLPNESKGLLRPSSTWRGSERINVSFGYGVGVTTLQLAAAMNVIANDGVYVAPRILRATIDGTGTVQDAPPAASRSVIGPLATAEMQRVLQTVICRQGATGNRAAIPGYAVAGKTGTAYKAQPNGTYQDDAGNRHYSATFAGYVPAEQPRLTLAVSIDEPITAHFGGTAAAPLFVTIGQEALRLLAVPPSPDGGACEKTLEGADA